LVAEALVTRDGLDPSKAIAPTLPMRRCPSEPGVCAPADRRDLGGA
jgi:hypothetical protein